MAPFKFGCIVDDEHYCVRPQIEKEMKRHISGGQNLVIQGERRRGKSSLVVKCVRSIRGMGLLYVDLLGITSASDFCRRVADGIVVLDRSRSFLQKTAALLSSLRPLVVIDRDTGLPAISIDARSASDPSSVLTVMNMIAAHTKERRICVVFDEFQDILDIPDSKRVLSELRSKIQFLADTSFVFLGSVRNRMSEIFAHPRSPFFKSALEMSIGEMYDDSFVEFLVGRFKGARRSVDAEFVQKIIRDLDGVPGDVQELCDAIWQMSEPGDVLDDAHFERGLAFVFARENGAYAVFIKPLTDIQLRVLKALAVQGGEHPLSNAFLDEARITNTATIRRSLSALEKTGLVYLGPSGWKFASPFFREYVSRHSRERAV